MLLFPVPLDAHRRTSPGTPRFHFINPWRQQINLSRVPRHKLTADTLQIGFCRPVWRSSFPCDGQAGSRPSLSERLSPTSRLGKALRQINPHPGVSLLAAPSQSYGHESPSTVFLHFPPCESEVDKSSLTKCPQCPVQADGRTKRAGADADEAPGSSSAGSTASPKLLSPQKIKHSHSFLFLLQDVFK